MMKQLTRELDELDLIAESEIKAGKDAIKPWSDDEVRDFYQEMENDEKSFVLGYN
ncbi:hypothetical protein [Colwellia sp. MEBiC06753]